MIALNCDFELLLALRASECTCGSLCFYFHAHSDIYIFTRTVNVIQLRVCSCGSRCLFAVFFSRQKHFPVK